MAEKKKESRKKKRERVQGRKRVKTERGGGDTKSTSRYLLSTCI
jgi:hypothetical protein